MNALVKQEAGALAAPVDDGRLIETLSNSLYPGAHPDSVSLVLSYCRAAGLDPMQKPVHIVAMYVKDQSTGQGRLRDVVLPGIGLYRIQANRTGQYAGQDEPVFGPMVTMSLGGMEIEVPEWCSVTVYRMVGGVRCPFTAREFWIENYATKARDSRQPNSMWARRVRGQLAKCSEAQALRKAFPELGAQPTYEEMEGKSYDLDEIDATPHTVRMPEAKREVASEVVDAEAKAPAEPKRAPPPPPPAPPPAANIIEPGELKWIEKRFSAFGLDDAARAAFLARMGVADLAQATKEQFAAMRAELMKL